MIAGWKSSALVALRQGWIPQKRIRHLICYDRSSYLAPVLLFQIVSCARARLFEVRFISVEMDLSSPSR
jgi:hypothetical protein